MLGDSFVFGHGLNNSFTLPVILEEILNSQRNLEIYEVLNLGVPGYNTLFEVNRFEQLGLKYEPDLVIVGFLLNDHVDEKVAFALDHLLREFLHEKNFSPKEVLDIKRNTCDIQFFPFEPAFQKFVYAPMERLANHSIQNGFEVLVFAYPFDEIIGESKYLNLLQMLCDSLGFSLYYLPEEVGYSYEGQWILHPLDPHPSPYANSKTAKFLSEKIQKHYLNQAPLE